VVSVEHGVQYGRGAGQVNGVDPPAEVFGDLVHHGGHGSSVRLALRAERDPDPPGVKRVTPCRGQTASLEALYDLARRLAGNAQRSTKLADCQRLVL
jgi:hypothetical protein